MNVLIYIITILLFYGISFGGWELIVQNGVAPQWASIIVYAVLAVVYFLIHRKAIIERFKEFAPQLGDLSYIFIRLVLPMVLGVAGTYLLVYVMGSFFNVDILPTNNENIKEIQAEIPHVIMFLYMVILGPIIEEIAFRESFFIWIPKEKKALKALMTLLSIILFAAMHVDIFVEKAYEQILYYIPLAIALTYVYLQEDESFAASSVAHMITNFIAFFAALLGGI